MLDLNGSHALLASMKSPDCVRLFSGVNRRLNRRVTDAEFPADPEPSRNRFQRLHSGGLALTLVNRLWRHGQESSIRLRFLIHHAAVGDWKCQLSATELCGRGKSIAVRRQKGYELPETPVLLTFLTISIVP